MDFLIKIIELYKINYRQDPDSWIEFAKQQKNLIDAINISSLNNNDQGKLHPHQYRINKVSIEKFNIVCLQNSSLFKKVKKFHDLIELLESFKIKGISDLTIYDTATRIGAYLNIFPDRVYLHRGTRTGATKLLGKINKPFLLKSDLPKAFQAKNLSYAEIEDILCIFKDKFTNDMSLEEFKSKCIKRIRGRC